MPIREDLFAHVLTALRAGATQVELSEELHQCVERARITGKSSKLTLTLTIKPNGNSGQYTLTEDIKAKLPRLDRGATLMFGTPEGNLQRQDPNQRALDLKPVEERNPTVARDAS